MESATTHEAERLKVSEKPIMQLFQRLINNDNQQNTVLTNKQITDILQNEFHMETALLHEFELEVYVYVIKKFLKDWPQWDEFDRTVNKLKTKQNYILLKKTLIAKYYSLKEYLEGMLDAIKPYTKQPVNKIGKVLGDNSNAAEDDVVLEIQCSRLQFNELIFPQPQPVSKSDYKTVFNVIQNNPPCTISLSRTPLQAILNCSGFIIQLNLSGLSIKREAKHDLEHVLINKALFNEHKPKPLNQNLQVSAGSVSKTIKRDYFENMLDENIKKFLSKNTQEDVTVVLETVLADLAYLPDSFQVPASYRKFMSKYSYVRYLFASKYKVQGIHNYNLQIEETISPRFEFGILLKADSGSSDQANSNVIGLLIECEKCKVTFYGDGMLERLKNHYMEVHQRVNDSGPDFVCYKCMNSFKMSQLAQDRWSHNCLTE